MLNPVSELFGSLPFSDCRERDSQKPKRSVFAVCNECGKKFYSVGSAEKASFDGCGKCGGVDVEPV